MAKSDKENLDASASETNTGAGFPPPSSEPGATTPSAAGSQEPAAGQGGAASSADAAAKTADGGASGAVEGEVVEPEIIEPASEEEGKPGVEALEKARAEAAEWHDKYLRLHAEWDTYRRRTTEQREAEKARATEKLVTGLLPVIDDFERTIDYATNNGETGLLDGVKAVHTKFIDVLKKDGVEVIDPRGQAFDALEAQAVATVSDESVPDETVADVYQRGYRLGTKVLRPAMVTVTTGGPREKKEQPQADSKA